MLGWNGALMSKLPYFTIAAPAHSALHSQCNKLQHLLQCIMVQISARKVHICHLWMNIWNTQLQCTVSPRSYISPLILTGPPIKVQWNIILSKACKGERWCIRPSTHFRLTSISSTLQIARIVGAHCKRLTYEWVRSELCQEVHFSALDFEHVGCHASSLASLFCWIPLRQ